MDVKKLNTTSLAYIGDAVYEVYIRSHVMEKDAAHTDALHRRAVAFVRADGQAQVIKRLMREREAAQTDKRACVSAEYKDAAALDSGGDLGGRRGLLSKTLDAGESAEYSARECDSADVRFLLTAEEAALVRRARNRKSATKPKNVDPITYKWATAFEALVGFLYLTGQTERLDLFAKTAISYIENELWQK